MKQIITDLPILNHRRLLLASAIAFFILETAVFPGWSQDFTKSGGSTSTTSTASRGGCPNTPKPLKALVPIGDGNGGLTVQAHPTIWVYVPHSLTPEKTIKFVLQDQQKQDVYKTTLPATGTAPGIIGLTLPAHQPLEMDKRYT